MKKLFAITTSIAYFSLPAISYAATIGDPCAGAGSFRTLCGLGKNGQIGPTIGSIINLLFLIAGIIALFYLVQGGIKWITSEGDSKNVEAARNQIIGAIVGLGITFLSYLIINLLLQFFLNTTLNSLTLPTLQGS